MFLPLAFVSIYFFLADKKLKILLNTTCVRSYYGSKCYSNKCYYIVISSRLLEQEGVAMAKVKKITALYIRTSTSYQKNGLEAQERKLKEHCKRLGLERYEIYADEDQSGKKRNRPELDRLKIDIKAGKVGTVLTYSMSRISRSTKDLLDISDLFNSYNIEFISLSENIDTTTPTGRLFYTILGAFSQFEREVISERVKTGLENARAKGKRIGGHNKRHNYALIRALKKQGMSYRSIAKEANCSLGSVVQALKTT